MHINWLAKAWRMVQTQLMRAEQKKYNFEVNIQGTLKVQVMGAQPVLMYNQ